MSAIKEHIIAVVQAIPPGQVASYGQVAQIVQGVLSHRVTAQLVGRQLSGMPRSDRSQLPWWRVINKQGFVSTIKLGDKGREQEALLRDEGIVVDHHCVPMTIYGISQEALVQAYHAHIAS